jgi:hypothetical protein
MTKEQRELIEAHGPYRLRKDGVLIDGNGFALAAFHDGSSPCEWDRAVVHMLNDVYDASLKPYRTEPT